MMKKSDPSPRAKRSCSSQLMAKWPANDDGPLSHSASRQWLMDCIWRTSGRGNVSGWLKDWVEENKVQNKTTKKKRQHIIFMELLAAESIHYNGKKNQLCVWFCQFCQVAMKLFIAHTHTHTAPDLWRWRHRSADTTPPCGCCSTRPSSTRNCGTSPLRRQQEATLWSRRPFWWTSWTLDNCLGKAELHNVGSFAETF